MDRLESSCHASPLADLDLHRTPASGSPATRSKIILRQRRSLHEVVFILGPVPLRGQAILQHGAGVHVAGAGPVWRWT